MSQSIPNREACKNDLIDKHWRHDYHWKRLSIDKVAAHFDLTEQEVVNLMYAIEKEYPAPQPKTQPKPPASDTCKDCGAEIVWMDGRAFDPPVMKCGFANGKIQPARRWHQETCKANRWKSQSGHAAAYGE